MSRDKKMEELKPSAAKAKANVDVVKPLLDNQLPSQPVSTQNDGHHEEIAPSSQSGRGNTKISEEISAAKAEKESKTKLKWQSVGAACALLQTWIILGAITFSYIESSNSKDVDNRMESWLQQSTGHQVVDFDISDGFNVTALLQVLTKATGFEIEHLESNASALRMRVSNQNTLLSSSNSMQGMRNSSSNHQWDIVGSIFYCVTIVTTIGYGNFAPQTRLGRFVTVIYAIIGIPIMAITMSNIAQLYMKFAIIIDRKVLSQRSKCCRPCDTSEYSPEAPEATAVAAAGLQDERQASWKALTLIIFLGVIFFSYLFSVFLWYMEDWDYRTSLYYTYVSLSTIGFGDVIAGMQDYRNYGSYALFIAYRMCLSLWLIFGISFLSVVMSTVQKRIEHCLSIRCCDASCNRCSASTDTDEPTQQQQQQQKQ